MLLIAIRVLYAFVCAGFFATCMKSSDKGDPPWMPNIVSQSQPFLNFLVMFLISQSVTIVDLTLRRKRIDTISSVYFGLLIGSLLSYLLSIGLQPIFTDPTLHRFVFITTTIMLTYISISFLLQTKDDFRFVIPYVEFVKEVKGGRPLVLDTSALIDGRIADLTETRIFDTELIVPHFVLQEVQDIADSSDKMRRTRGRRGLDVLAKLQQSPHVDVRVYEAKDKELENQSVDHRILALAKRISGRVVTNDYNLNKVASVQGVDVINLNDAANALKPRYLPGESIRIRVQREGEGIGQGVGYLDDGTMVVCEQASTLIGKEVDVIVTSMLQNSAGRMIFGRLVTAQQYSSR